MPAACPVGIGDVEATVRRECHSRTTAEINERVVFVSYPFFRDDIVDEEAGGLPSALDEQLLFRIDSETAGCHLQRHRLANLIGSRLNKHEVAGSEMPVSRCLDNHR